jgi:hypothetical protein
MVYRVHEINYSTYQVHELSQLEMKLCSEILSFYWLLQIKILCTQYFSCRFYVGLLGRI